jgi:purine-cytosine permease-like protein
MTDDRRNVVAFIAILIVTVTLAGLMAALIGSHAGEIASALGSVIGGAIGALGSAATVYIMLKGQRDDEVEKVMG